MRQCFTSEFPTHPNREFFVALQGIESGDHGIFWPDQGRGCRDCRAGFLAAWQQIIGRPSVPYLSLIEPAVKT
jgi:hypothetical protein